MTFLFDTNIFIRSKNEMPMDIWPTFWTTMQNMISSGMVFISIKVKEEIDKGKDELTEWIKTNAPQSCLIDIDENILQKFADVQNWANDDTKFSKEAQLTFAGVADSYLVATAAAKGMTLVTYEKSNKMSKRRVLIPDACTAIGAKCCDLNTALREMGVKI